MVLYYIKSLLLVSLLHQGVKDKNPRELEFAWMHIVNLPPCYSEIPRLDEIYKISAPEVINFAIFVRGRVKT
jgi:hypothetical protein